MKFLQLKYFTVNILLFVIFVIIVGCGGGSSSPSTDTNTSYTEMENIILMIGDGMGSQHLQAARWKNVGFDGKLQIDTLPNYGLIETASADTLITDSAAAATAMATGVKTNNGVIGLDASLNLLETILEKAKTNGKSVGLVTNVQIAHATPAAFAAHVDSRNDMITIASQIMENNVDVILGGGEDEFLPNSTSGCYPELGERSDGRNLINEAINSGYTYVCNETQLQDVNTSSAIKLLGLFADEGMSRPYSPTLEIMTQKAIEILSKNPNGFFLMVEGGQIDWASHNNDTLNTMNDTIDFDRAVDTALNFYNSNDNTLLIVTSDHETGGMSVSTNSTGLESEDGPYYTPTEEAFYVNWSTTGHTSANVPIRAIGSNSNFFLGTHENIDIFQIMKESFNF